MDHFGRGYAFFQYSFAVGVVIVGDGQNERSSVFHGNQFLLRGKSKGTIAHQVAAFIRSQRGSQHFGGASRGAVHQNGNRTLPNHFSGFSRENLFADGLPLERGEIAGRHKQPGDGNRFGGVAP